MKKTAEKLLLLILSILLLVLSPSAVYADEDQGTRNLTATYYVVTTSQNNSITVPYNPEWFTGDATEYSHDLAKLSLGLTVSAFRPGYQNTVPSGSPDTNAVNFLTQAGFADLQSDDYEKNPSIYTISTIMGHTKIGEGDDAFELIAVGVCGQGYRDEWESNFSIGSEDIHEGFRGSAQQVFNRIFGYIASRRITGKIKLWITGFSRAAAVSNITAAMLNESEAFSEENVFAYTFATPRTTRNPSAVSCSNIFNIVGKMDPVSYIPFADWDYDRYGTTLYTPELETDSDYMTKRTKANVIYKDVTGIDFWSNIEMHNEVMIIMDYLLKICPTTDDYVNNLQDKIITLWDDHSPLSVLTNLLEIGNNPALINSENRHEANAFLDYITFLALDYTTRSNSFRKWNTSASAGSNLLQGHTPELYISWVYSTDTGDDLYSSSDKYTFLFVPLRADVSLYRDDRLIETYAPYSPENVSNYLNVIGDKLVVLIPDDDEYSVHLRFPADQDVELFDARYTVGYQAPEKTTIMYYDVRAGEELDIEYGGGSSTYSSEASFSKETDFVVDDYLSISDMISLEKRNVLNLSWRTIVLLSISAAIIFTTMIMFQLVYIFGRLRFHNRKELGWIPKSEKFRGIPLILGTSVMQIFLIGEFSNALFPEMAFAPFIYKILTGTLIILIAAYGYFLKRDRFHLRILEAVMIMTLADIIISYYLILGTLIHSAAFVLLSYTYWNEEKPVMTQKIVYLILTAASLLLIFIFGSSFGLMMYIAMIWSAAAIMMAVSSVTMPRQCFTGSLLIIFGGVLLMLSFVFGESFGIHLLARGMYCFAMLTLAGTGTVYKLPKLVPEDMLDPVEELK